MRIEQTKQTVQTVGDIVSVETDVLVIETPDPVQPKPLAINITVNTPDDAPSFKATKDRLWQDFASGGYVDSTRPKPEPRYGTVEPPVHFDCHKPGENLAALHEFKDPFHNPKAGDRACAPIFDEHEFQAKARRDRPNRDIPLWAFQRDFILQEFPNLGPHGAAKLADHFMDQWRRSYHRPAGRSDGQGSRP